MAHSEPSGQLQLDWREYGGFVVEARDSRNHPIIGYGKQVKPLDPDRGFCYSVNEAWRDLLHECRFTDGYVMNGGRKMLLRRGELTGAVSWLGSRWNWSPKTVRVFLDKLEGDGMITMTTPGVEKASDSTSPNDDAGASKQGNQRGKQKGKQSTVITVCNYERFNPLHRHEGQAKGQEEGQEEGKQGASKGQARGNIYKEEQLNTGTTEQLKKVVIPPTPVAPQRPEPALVGVVKGQHEGDLFGIREGEEHVGFGVLVNCETVRHAEFEINLNGIAGRLGGAIPFDAIKEFTTGAALQWATDIANGKGALPRDPAAYIVTCLINKRAADEASEKRRGKRGKAADDAGIGGEIGRIFRMVQDAKGKSL